MRRRKWGQAGGNKAFALAEMIVAIGALAIVGIVVMQLFVQAAAWESRARDLDMACFETQGVIETLKVSGDPDDIGSILREGAMRISDGEWVLYFDDEWNAAAAEPERGFIMSISITPAPAGEARSLTVTVAKIDPAQGDEDDGIVFSLPDIQLSGRGAA